MSICIYICMCVNIYMYTCMHTCIYIYTCLRTPSPPTGRQRYVGRFFLCLTLFLVFYIPCCVVCLKPQLTVLALKRLSSLLCESLSVDSLDSESGFLVREPATIREIVPVHLPREVREPKGEISQMSVWY